MNGHDHEIAKEIYLLRCKERAARGLKSALWEQLDFGIQKYWIDLVAHVREAVTPPPPPEDTGL